MMKQYTGFVRLAVASAFVISSYAVHTPIAQAQSVELIGLHQWTRQMVKDSLARHVPGSDTTLTTHACGAELLKLGFVRTASIYYPSRIVVTVVEPQDSARVRNNPLPKGLTRALSAEWQTIMRNQMDENGKPRHRFQFVADQYPKMAAVNRDSMLAVFHADPKRDGHIDSLLTFFAAHTSAADRATAIDILQNDSVMVHRMFALAMLSGFPEQDDAWGAVMHALRDRNDILGVWGQAQDIMLAWLSGRGARAVNWSSRTEDLRALLAGANLWTLPQVMGILAATRVDPSLAKPLLADNATFVLGYAGSADANAARPAIALLSQLSGQRYGNDVGKWRGWVGTL